MIKQTLTREWQELKLTQGTLRNTNTNNRVELAYSSSIPNENDGGILYGDYTFPIYALEGQKVYARSFDLDTLEVVLYKGFDLRVIGGIGGGTSGESPIAYKGSVGTYSDLLALTGVKSGDIYNVLSTGANYIYDGTTWDKFSEDIDISGKLDVGAGLPSGITGENIYDLANFAYSYRDIALNLGKFTAEARKNQILRLMISNSFYGEIKLFNTTRFESAALDYTELSFLSRSASTIELGDIYGKYLNKFAYTVDTTSVANYKIIDIGINVVAGARNSSSYLVQIIPGSTNTTVIASIVEVDASEYPMNPNVFNNDFKILGKQVIGYMENSNLIKNNGEIVIGTDGKYYEYIYPTPSNQTINFTEYYKEYTLASIKGE